MNFTHSMRRLVKPVRLALVAGVATLLVGAVLTIPAGAAPAPPYATSTTVHSSVAMPVTGQAVTFTATVKALGKNVPNPPPGTVVFTITGSDSSTPTCDGATNTFTLSGGTAQCTFSGGLLASASPYSVSVAYTDTVDSNDNPSNGSLSQTVNPGHTSTVVTSSSNPTTTGAPVTFSAAVSILSPAQGTLSGSVTFVGVTCDGPNPAPVVSGVAQCVISEGLTSAGSPYTVTGTYGSDTEFAGSSGKVKQSVTPAGTTLTLAATPDTCNGDFCTSSQGTPLTFTATASSADSTPTGNVVFLILPAGKTKAKDSLTCDGGNTVALSGGQASCSFANGLSAIVYYTVTATLQSPNYQTSSATLYENTQELSTDTTVAVPNNLTTGETFPVTATVTPLSSSTNPPTGNVDITVCGSDDNGNNGCQGDVEPLTGNTAVLEVAGGEFTGAYTAYASYLGDGNYYGSTAKKKLFHVVEGSTTTTITSSENPSNDGDAVTLTATVTAENGGGESTLVGPPSGSVTFTITGPDGTETCQGGNVIPLDNGSADEDVAQCYLPPGTLTDPAAPTGNTTYSVVADWPSDGDFSGSHGNLNQVVVPVED